MIKSIRHFLAGMFFILFLTGSVVSQDPVATQVDNLIKQGIAAYNNKNRQEAERLFRQAIDLEDKNNLPALRRNITSYVYLSDILAQNPATASQSAAVVDRILKSEKSSAWAYRTVAFSNYTSGTFNKRTVDYMTEAILLEPGNPENYARRAFALGYYPNLAFEDYARAEKLDPNYAPTYFERGSLYLSMGEYDKALAQLDKYLQLNAVGPARMGTYYVARGMTLLFGDRITEAIEAFNKAIENNAAETQQTKLRGYFYRGYAHLLNKNRPAAQADMTEAAKNGLETSDLIYRLAFEALAPGKCRSEKDLLKTMDKFYKDKKLTDTAAREFELLKIKFQRLECYPDSSAAVSSYANQLGGRYDDIILSNLRKAQRLAGSTIESDEVRQLLNKRFDRDRNIGGPLPKLYVPAMNFESSPLRLLYETTRLDIYENVKASLNDIRAWMKNDGFQHKALAHLNRMIEEQPNNIEAQFARMEAYYLKGARIHAYREADKFIKANPKNSFAFNMRGRVNLDLGRTDAALADYKSAITNEPFDEIAYINRGKLYVSLNQPAPALQDFNRALELAPKNGDALYFRAQLFYQQNKFENAITDLLKAIDITGSTDARLLLIQTYDKAGYKPLADLQHKFLLKFAPGFEGLKEISGRNPGMETQYTAALAIDLYIYNVNNWMKDLNETTQKTVIEMREFVSNPPQGTDARKRQVNLQLQAIGSIIYYAESIERESRKILTEVQTFSPARRQEIEKLIGEMQKVKSDAERDKKRLEDLNK